MMILAALTPGVRMSQWEKVGTFQRELQPYYNYVSRGAHITFLQTAPGTAPNLPESMSIQRLPHWRFLKFWEIASSTLRRKTSVIRTNQTNRSDLFVRLGQNWQKPVVIRGGYIYGEYRESIDGLTPQVRKIQRLEAWAFQNATLIQLPTPQLAEWAVAHYRTDPTKIRIVPNFVDTMVFKPTKSHDAPVTMVISVGRLSAEKRFDLILRGCSLIGGVQVKIAGEGEERDRLKLVSQELNIPLVLPGNIPNDALPDFLNSGDIFMLTSLREGHPKALIEAMSCGLPCVCLRSPGIENIIQHETNGLLADDEQSLADALRKLMSNVELRAYLGKNAREYVIEHFDLRAVLNLDAGVIEEAVSSN